MTRLVPSILAAAVVALFLSPIGFFGDTHTVTSEGLAVDESAPMPLTDELVFPGPIDTSVPVPEYTMVSRALMLNGGSSDVVMEDMNDDGLTDLVVSVYESLTISVFFRQVDGTFKTNPSLNITTQYHPLSIGVADLLSVGKNNIIALGRGSASADTHLVIYNLTSESTYEKWLDKSTWGNGAAFVIGEFSGDAYLDIAVLCEALYPDTDDGRLEVRFGPTFSTFELLNVGRGAGGIAAGDIDDDAELEIAVGNYYDSSVMVFERPFTNGGVPTMTLSVDGMPASLIAGQLNDDALIDLVVGTEVDDALRFFFQGNGSLPAVEDMNISLEYAPSVLASGMMDSDLKEDILILSESGNVSLGFYQSDSAPFWGGEPDFVISCGGIPRSAVIGHLDADADVDIAVASARADWSGSSLALYPSRLPTYSNSNETAWTRKAVETTCIACGDVNGDDVEDLVMINPSDQSLDYMLAFEDPIETLPLGHNPERILVRDLNGDGSADVLVTVSDAPAMLIVYGGPDFPNHVVEMLCSGPITDAEFGDFNHDSMMDIILSTYDGRLIFYFNDGSENAFSEPYEIVPSGGAGIRSVAVGDFNSDGMDDVAYPQSILKITVLLQDMVVPFGPSSPSLTLTYPSGGDFALVWSGDLTGDGKTDIAAMRPADTSMYIFDQNDFMTSGTSSLTLDFPEEPAFLSVVDATDDGPVDIIAIFASADLLFLYRQSSGALPSSPSMVFVTGARPSYAIIGDGTNDHRGDLLVNDAGSSSVSIWQQINFPPIAHSGGPYLAREGDSLQLNGSATTGTSEIPYMEYRWDFGDGENTSWVRQPRPTHTYLAMGNYTILMEVKDPTGLLSSEYTYVNVLDSYPHVSFSWDPEVVNEGELVSFTDETTSFDPIANKSWYVNGEPYGNDTVIQVRFQNGTQEITLSVTDSDGTFASITAWIDVGALPPTLRIVAPTEADEGMPVEFIVLVDEWHGGPVDPIVSYEWDFSYVDGSFVPDPTAPNNYTASHVFSTSSYWKVYRVAVRVTDSDGMSSTETCDIRIFDSAPVAGLAINTTDPCEGIPFVIISTSTSYDGVTNWTWRLVYPNGSEEFFWLDDRAMAEHEFDYLDDGDYVMHLTIQEADGNTSTSQLWFNVRELPPLISLVTEPPIGMQDYYQEFMKVNFTCEVGGLDPGVLWEWDFESAESQFVVDSSTEVGSATHVYQQIGDYTAKVRVFDSDGSMAEDEVIVQVRQKPLGCEMYLDIRVLRVAPDTENVRFNVTNLLLRHPDVIKLTFEFGDGGFEYLSGPPFPEVYHSYAIGRDYLINVTIEDDDGYVVVSRGTIFVDPPVIELLDPFDGAVVRSGTTILFLVTPGSTPLSVVVFDVNDEGFRPFATQYLINTTGWVDASYNIAVIAWDHGGNVAILRYVRISIDDYPPVAVVHSEKTKVHAGDRFAITVWVADRNVVASGVTLHVMFPGDRAFLTYPVTEGTAGNFFREFDAPAIEGSILFFVQITDKAGNSVVSDLYSLDIRIPFLTVAWPYLLTASLIAAVGIVGYFVREKRIAVDETFVIHNDGRMISHSTRRLKPGMDDQVLSSMFTAIQDFVKESFKDITSFTLRKIEFGEKSVLIEKGRNVYLAVILHGHASRKVAAKMQRVLDEIESKFDAHLTDWDGDLEKLRGINDITKKIYSKAPLLPKRVRS